MMRLMIRGWLAIVTGSLLCLIGAKADSACCRARKGVYEGDRKDGHYPSGPVRVTPHN